MIGARYSAVLVLIGIVLSSVGVAQDGVKAECAQGQSAKDCAKTREISDSAGRVVPGCRLLVEKSFAEILASGDFNFCETLSGRMAMYPELKTSENLDLVRQYKAKRLDGLESACAQSLESGRDRQMTEKEFFVCRQLSTELGVSPELDSPSKREVLEKASARVVSRGLAGQKTPPSVDPSSTSPQEAEAAARNLIQKCKAACSEPEPKCTPQSMMSNADCFVMMACYCNCVDENTPANYPDKNQLKKCVADAQAQIARLRSSPAGK